MKINYKHQLLLLLLFIPLTSMAVELVCSGYPAADDSQRKVIVNCSDRQEVLGYLSAGFSLLRERQMPTYMEDMCWHPLKTLKEYPPDMIGGDMVSNFFRQCNESLKSFE